MDAIFGRIAAAPRDIDFSVRVGFVEIHKASKWLWGGRCSSDGLPGCTWHVPVVPSCGALMARGVGEKCMLASQLCTPPIIVCPLALA